MPTDRAPVALLGGFPLLGSSREGWIFTEGSSPSTQVMALRPDDAQKLLDNNHRSVSLLLAIGPEQLEIQHLWVLQEVPGPNPNVKYVMVADRRWMWAHRQIERDYNVPRNVGTIRYTSSETNENVVITTPNLLFWEWSLIEDPQNQNSPFKPWLMSDCIKDVLTDVCSVDPESVPIRIFENGLGKTETDRVNVQALVLRDDGQAALNRLKSIVPAIGIKVEPDGSVVVYRKDKAAADTREGIITVKNIGLGAISETAGVFAQVNNRLLRPSKINIYYEKEMEIRIDANEGGTIVEGDLYMTNVAPVPDPEILIGDKTYYQGTYVPVDDLIDRWGLEDKAFTKANILKAAVPLGSDMFNRLALSGVLTPGSKSFARAQCLQKHFRQTYQISRFWMNRLKSIRANLVSTINQATAARAPSPCFSDVAVVASQRGKLNRSVDDQFLFMNIQGYPDNGLLRPMQIPAGFEQISPAPCRVYIIDADQGIIFLEFDTDVYGNQAQIAPSIVENNPNPNYIKNPSFGPITVDAICSTLDSGKYPHLVENDKKSVIMTAMPASPNNLKRLHKITVLPSDVEFKLGGSRIGDCVGPEMDMLIGPNTATAKFTWLDARKNDIKRGFGYPDSRTPANLTGLCLNDTPTTEPTGANIRELAVSYATQIYLTLLDRLQGEQASDFSPDVELKGWQDQVSHMISTEGKMTTTVRFPPKLPRMSIAEFLSGDTRRAIFRLASVQPVGSV